MAPEIFVNLPDTVDQPAHVQVKAVRALLKALAARYPGQPVTVAFGGGGLPEPAMPDGQGHPQRRNLHLIHMPASPDPHFSRLSC